MAEKAKLRFAIPFLGARRAEAVLSQDQLAQRAGVARGTIIRLERGGHANAPTVQKLAKALGISAQQLLREEPTKKEFSGVA